MRASSFIVIPGPSGYVVYAAGFTWARAMTMAAASLVVARGGAGSVTLFSVFSLWVRQHVSVCDVE